MKLIDFAYEKVDKFQMSLEFFKNLTTVEIFIRIPARKILGHL